MTVLQSTGGRSSLVPRLMVFIAVPLLVYVGRREAPCDLIALPLAHLCAHEERRGVVGGCGLVVVGHDGIDEAVEEVAGRARDVDRGEVPAEALHAGLH